MTNITAPSHRRSITRRSLTQRRLLLLLVCALAGALAATVLQVSPQSHAAEVNDVQVSHRDPEASIKAGTENVCVIRNSTNISGDEDRVEEVVDAVSTSAREAGYAVTTGGFNTAPDVSSLDLVLTQEFTMTDPDAGPENCTDEGVIDEHRGRSTLSLPGWVRGMLAAAAGIAVYLAVVFAVAAIFSFLAPELFIWGEVIGGCIAGFASTFVSNLINQVPRSQNLTGAAVQCVAGALLNVTLGSVKQNMVSELRGWVNSGAAHDIVETGSSRAGSAAASEAAEEFESARSTLAQELEEISVEDQP